MKVFPGSFPPPVFEALTLDRYAEAYTLAIDFAEADARAAKEFTP